MPGCLPLHTPTILWSISITEYFPTVLLLYQKCLISLFYFDCEVNFNKEVQLENTGALNIFVIFTKKCALRATSSRIRASANMLWAEGLVLVTIVFLKGLLYTSQSKMYSCVCVYMSQQSRSVRFPRGGKTLGKFLNTLGFPIKSENSHGHHNSGRENLHWECPWRPPHVPFLLTFRRIPGWQSLKTEFPLHATRTTSHKTSDSVRDISHEADSKRVGTGHSCPSRASVPSPPWA